MFLFDFHHNIGNITQVFCRFVLSLHYSPHGTKIEQHSTLTVIYVNKSFNIFLNISRAINFYMNEVS